MKKYIFWSLLFCLSSRVSAQVASPLEWIDFRAQVAQYHPEAKRAQLQIDLGRARLFSAKGGFDVKTFADYASKNFNKKEYFSHLETGVKLPTWYGLELKTGWNYANGLYINPEEQLPSQGQATLGVSWTLGQGLFMDDRRADLRLAQAGIQLETAVSNSALNDLFYDAAKIYWTWAFTDQQVGVVASALEQARIRHNGMKERFSAGDLPAIDTLESFIQLQNRLIDLQFAQNEVKNNWLSLQTFLWSAQNTPAPTNDQLRAPEISTATPPPAIERSAKDSLIAAAIAAHPDLSWYQAKMKQLQVEQRLKNEKLKPLLNVNYNVLGTGWQFFSQSEILTKDIKWGVNFAMPITNRKARGEVQMAKIKISQTDLSIRQKQLEIENKIKRYLNDLDNLAQQLQLYQNITNNYQTLLEAENEKLKAGESSVFLINTREQRWLDARIKYLKLWSEYRKTEAALRWAAGQG